MRLAYAMTIHKSQGETLERTVVDIGKRELASGLSFVALSRVRHITQLAAVDFPLNRLNGLSKTDSFKKCALEENRLNVLAQETLLQWYESHM